MRASPVPRLLPRVPTSSPRRFLHRPNAPCIRLTTIFRSLEPGTRLQNACFSRGFRDTAPPGNPIIALKNRVHGNRRRAKNRIRFAATAYARKPENQAHAIIAAACRRRLRRRFRSSTRCLLWRGSPDPAPPPTAGLLRRTLVGRGPATLFWLGDTFLARRHLLAATFFWLTANS